jgi:hypothetical protein
MKSTVCSGEVSYIHTYIHMLKSTRTNDREEMHHFTVYLKEIIATDLIIRTISEEEE